MLNGREIYRFAGVCALTLAICAGVSGESRAQEFVYRGGAANGPTIGQYLEQAGPDSSLVAHGGLNTQVKLYVYSHECGHQFIGADEVKADLFSIRRGVKWGWLDAQGLEDICVFISKLKGDAVHPPGPKRCDIMREYYRKLVGGSGQRASSGSTSGAQTLGPSN